MRSLLLIGLLLMGSCAAGPRGAVQPAPPGPVDLLRMMVGDFSGLCPRRYEYCRGGRHSICCPVERGCCRDADGAPTCCANSGSYRDEYAEPQGRDYDEDDDDDDTDEAAPPPESSCPSSDLTCIQGERRVCCSRHDACCVDKHGPYCCQGRAGQR